MGAQYSIPYCAAVAVTADPGDPALYGEDVIDDTARRELAQRVELVIDKDMEAVYPKHYGARVELHLANGQRRDSFVLDPHGMPGDPCSEAERIAKFTRLASGLLSAAATQDVITAVRNCDRAASVREFTRLLRPDQASASATA
jgi:2-methylcitrate dehydratase PrpD